MNQIVAPMPSANPAGFTTHGAWAVYRRLRTIPCCNASGEDRVPLRIARSLPLGLSALAAKDVATHARKLRNVTALDFSIRD
jgi:hypothetical protein